LLGVVVLRRRRERYSFESDHCNGALRNCDIAVFIHFQTGTDQPKAASGRALLGRQSARQPLEQMDGCVPFDLGAAYALLALALAFEFGFPFSLELPSKAWRGLEERGDGKRLAVAVYEINVA
jgi:hypothetical protein